MTVNEVADRYDNIPQMIVENGFGAFEELVVEDGEERVHDPYRTSYLEAHVEQMGEAIDDGCNLIGYTWWGPIDLVSAGTGEYAKRSASSTSICTMMDRAMAIVCGRTRSLTVSVLSAQRAGSRGLK